MKFEEITGLKPAELRVKIQKLKKELFNSRMKLKIQRLSNPLTIRVLRRDIARMQTALSQNKNNSQKGQAS